MGTKTDLPSHGGRRAGGQIIAIPDCHLAAVVDTLLGRQVIGKAGIAVQMVLGHIENRGHFCTQAVSGFQLEAGQFQHIQPGLIVQ